jgi:nitrogen fixation NifU-like protein
MEGEKILLYGKNPQFVGELKECSCIHTEKNETCGEFFTVYLLLENNILKDARYASESRMVGTACMEILIDEFLGKSLEPILEITETGVLDRLEVSVLTEKRMKSALLPLLALQNAYRVFKGEGVLQQGEVCCNRCSLC